MRVLIVIVNYRTAGLTVDCLRSLAPQVGEVAGGCRVVVTDNASGDGSADLIADAIATHGWGGWARLVPLDRNGGFAYGNNEGIRPFLAAGGWRPARVRLPAQPGHGRPAGGGRRTRLVPRRRTPTCGIAGGRAENADGTVRRSSFRFPSVRGEVEQTMRLAAVTKLLDRHKVAPEVPPGPSRVDWVSGASMMVRRSVFETIGLLDDGFFMYYEETDFCLRAATAGFECWYVPASRVIHLVGQSSGVTGVNKAKKPRPTYWFDSRRRYFRKSMGVPKAVAADVIWLGLYPLSRLHLLLRRVPAGDPPGLYRDFARHSLFASPRSR